MGKSSLVKALLPEREIRIQAISQATGHGAHTTTTSTLYHLPGGGDLIDTPGVRSFELGEIVPDALDRGFPELTPHLGRCRFSDCRHQGEAGRRAGGLARGEIVPRRLDSYLRLRAELTATRPGRPACREHDPRLHGGRSAAGSERWAGTGAAAGTGGQRDLAPWRPRRGGGGTGATADRSTDRVGRLLALRPLTGQDLPLALLHLGGGLYLAWLSLESLRFSRRGVAAGRAGNLLRRGVIANILNPNPYLFWLAVGAPTVLAAWRREPLAAVAFIAAFYLPLVGAKLALLLNRLRHALRSRGYVVLMRGLGGLLMAYALWWLYEGGRRLAMGWLKRRGAFETRPAFSTTLLSGKPHSLGSTGSLSNARTPKHTHALDGVVLSPQSDTRLRVQEQTAQCQGPLWPKSACA